MKTFSTPNWLRRNCIGKGSFGTVSLAVDKSDDRFTFAVKSANQNFTDSVRCLENEIKILKSLSSPYVVTYLGDDMTCEFRSVYRNLHIEYMPCGTLADVAKARDTANVKNYTRCLTSALSYIHARNIVHCDVKGSNVLIGNVSGAAKLADFGCAVELGVSVPVPVTRGTPRWMAPEVVRGEYIGPESDVWSLGCTVIEMLTGNPPWQDRGVDTFRQIGYSDVLPEIPTPVPEDLDDFLEKCLKRERSERWSCDQLLQHPFLLSCSTSSPPYITIDNCKLSPRCVFDWSDDLSSPNESTVGISQERRSNAKQRIGKLASNSRVNWETEGWEVVRHVKITDEATAGSEYSDSVDEETKGSCRGRANWEDGESTSGDARGTIVGWMCSVGVQCKIIIWVEELFKLWFLINSNVIQHIHYTEWFAKYTCVFMLLNNVEICT